MIFDKLENIDKYAFSLNFITEDLEKGAFNSGKFPINGDQEFGIGLEYTTKDYSEGLWESHRTYLDIHVILEGEEIIHINDISKMTSTKEYEPDYELFDGEKEFQIHLKRGYFLVLFPHEVHKTGIMLEKSKHVQKKVYKKLL